MKKSIRLHITGSVQTLFFEQFIMKHALDLKVRGYLRKLEDGRIEIFAEGDHVNVDKLISVAKTGPQHSQIRNIAETPEKFQDFKEFKIVRI